MQTTFNRSKYPFRFACQATSFILTLDEKKEKRCKLRNYLGINETFLSLLGHLCNRMMARCIRKTRSAAVAWAGASSKLYIPSTINIQHCCFWENFCNFAEVSYFLGVFFHIFMDKTNSKMQLLCILESALICQISVTLMS